MPKKVLIICEHNSARSQMFEEFLRFMGKGEYEVESAGLTPTQINPLVVEVMKEEGSDLSNKKTQSVFDLFKKGKLYDFVITVCDESTAAGCPVFPGIAHRLHLPFNDPSKFTGDHSEKLEQTRRVRDEIKEMVKEFIENPDEIIRKGTEQIKFL